MTESKTFYAGFDASAFPGIDNTAWLKANTNLVFAGFYLGPTPSHGHADWMSHRGALQAQGWGLVPIFVGQQTVGPGGHEVTAGQGTTDGDHAASLMRVAGFEPGRGVWLDLENGLPLTDPEAGYVQAWAEAVSAAGYAPKVYCSHAMAEAVVATGAVGPDDIWAFKVASTAEHAIKGTAFPAKDPGGSGYAGARVWQCDQNAIISVGAHQMLVDLNCATSPDPSAP